MIFNKGALMVLPTGVNKADGPDGCTKISFFTSAEYGCRGEL